MREEGPAEAMREIIRAAEENVDRTIAVTIILCVYVGKVGGYAL